MEGFEAIKRFIPDHAGDLIADSSSPPPFITTTYLPGPSGSQQSLQAGAGNAMDSSDAGDTGLKGQFSYEQSATLVPDGSPTPTIKTSFLTASSSSGGSSVAAGVGTSILTATTSPAITSNASAAGGSTITGSQLIAAIFLPIFLVSILGLSSFLFFQARRRRKARLHDMGTDSTAAGFTNQPTTAKELCDYSPRTPDDDDATTPDFYNPAHTLNAFAQSPSPAGTTAPSGPFSHLPVYSAFSRHGSAGSLDFPGFHDPLMRQTRLNEAQTSPSQQLYPTDNPTAAAGATTAAPPPPYMPRICTTPEGMPILQSTPSQPARLTEANLGHHRRASRGLGGLAERHAGHDQDDEDAVSEVSAREHDFTRRRRGGGEGLNGDADGDMDADAASVVSELSHTGGVPVVEHRIV
ncbi:MAG: hypothetical protein M1824_001351 [Vezdaea acicularis]|nr:MAG: hypothetical protein M1824_001351 [Vezdaea acicularis]